LDEQQGLRLTSNLVDVDPGEVHIGQRVEVEFERYGDIFLPVFIREKRCEALPPEGSR